MSGFIGNTFFSHRKRNVFPLKFKSTFFSCFFLQRKESSFFIIMYIIFVYFRCKERYFAKVSFFHYLFCSSYFCVKQHSFSHNYLLFSIVFMHEIRFVKFFSETFIHYILKLSSHNCLILYFTYFQFLTLVVFSYETGLRGGPTRRLAMQALSRGHITLFMISPKIAAHGSKGQSGIH